MGQGPLLALAARENVAEQLLGLAPIEEVVLVGRALVGIARRDRDADAELLGEIEEGGNIGRRMPVIDRGIDVDGKALGLGRLYCRHRAVEDAFLAYRLVVVLFQSIQ